MPMLKLWQHMFPADQTGPVYFTAVTLGTRAPPVALEVCNIRSSEIPTSRQVVVLPFHSGDSTARGSTADVEVDRVYSGSRSARRYRKQRSGLAPIAVQLAAPVTLGLLIGGVLAYQAGSTNNAVQPVPLGAVATPTASFGRPPASTPTAPAAPTPTPAAATTTYGNCGIIAPANPLSARRLATLYQLTGGMTSAGSGCT
jgi:hypothetical protein